MQKLTLRTLKFAVDIVCLVVWVLAFAKYQHAILHSLVTLVAFNLVLLVVWRVSDYLFRRLLRPKQP